jgi:hypothetical protein
MTTETLFETQTFTHIQTQLKIQQLMSAAQPFCQSGNFLQTTGKYFDI